jgi:hypothetical protein
MKIRLLSFLPQHLALKPGQSYDLADGAGFVSAGEAEALPGDAEVLADPRPPIEPAPAAETEADPAAEAAAPAAEPVKAKSPAKPKA